MASTFLFSGRTKFSISIIDAKTAHISVSCPVQQIKFPQQVWGLNVQSSSPFFSPNVPSPSFLFLAHPYDTGIYFGQTPRIYGLKLS